MPHLRRDARGDRLRVAHPVGGVGERTRAAARPQVQDALHAPPAIYAGSLYPLAVTLETAPADVGVERRRLHAEQLARLGGTQVGLPLNLDHVCPSAYSNRTFAVNMLQYKSTYA